jgi:glycosyltransferase involved in cell wall biosynthesis
MTILLVSEYCLVGGVEAFMLALASALHFDGHDCELFFFRHGPFEKYIPRHYVVHFGDLSDCLRLVDERRVDVVHAKTTDWRTGISAVRRLGAKLVVTSHGFRSLAWNSGNCDAFATCAKWLADEQQPLTDLPVKVVLNGIDTARFKPAGDLQPGTAPVIVCVGRGKDPRKRLDRFAAIAPALRSAGLRLRVVDPYGPDVVARVFPDAARQLAEVAEFWGAVPVERMPALYAEVAASGGCVVSTDEWEGLPLTLLEAQACGCPPIAPDVPGTNECVDPAHGGVLYQSDIETDALAKLVLDTVRADARMAWRRRTCAEYVRERFSAARMAGDYLRIYEESPYPPHGRYVARLRKRLLLSPLRHWDRYVEQRLSVGQREYDVAEQLAQRREWRLARAAAGASFATSPTMYVSPKKAALLANVYLHAAARARARRSA